MRALNVLWVAISGTTFLVACGCASNPPAVTVEQMAAEIEASHIEGNVPPPGDFDSLLERDLIGYFSETYKDPSIEFSPLRLGPTQSGISYPKFYYWVSVVSGGAVAIDGAARIAAVGGTYFDVTHFISRAEITANADTITSVFPIPVCQEIVRRLER